MLFGSQNIAVHLGPKLVQGWRKGTRREHKCLVPACFIAVLASFITHPLYVATGLGCVTLWDEGCIAAKTCRARTE